jgi:tetratricopeptide (TPR) repeat protein
MPSEHPEGETQEASSPTRGNRPASPAKGPRRVLAWAADHRLKAALVVAGCLLALAAVSAWWFRGTAPVAENAENATLERALDALDAGAYDEAGKMAETLQSGGLSPRDPLGAPAFLLGVATAHEADRAWPADKKDLYLVAARYLEEARDLGFPPGREGQGLFLLGRSLYLSGQMPACRPVLRAALEAYPANRTEIHRFLAAAYLEDANPKYPEALEHNGLYLADRTLLAEARHEGLLQRAEILLRLGRTPECLSTLDQIPPDAANRIEAIVTRGQVLMHQARRLKDAPEAAEADRLAAVEKYRAAIKTLRLAQGRDTLAAQATGKVMYLIAVCYQELGEHDAALHQFHRTSSKHPGTPEALAADFQAAELARQLGQNDEALAAYRRALRAVTDAGQYRNPWLALDAFRAGTLNAYQAYRDAEDFEICLQLTWLLYPLFSRERMVELTAETHQLWGRSLLARAGDLPLSKARPLERQGRAQLRHAGRAHEHLAALRVTTRHYLDDLWNSAECYREGRGYQKTAEILRQYLQSESRRRHPQALLNLGEASLALGQIDEALQAFDECIKFHPRDAASFQARLAASHVCAEKGQPERAETLLTENLDGDLLTPESGEWRDSLFALARLLHASGRYDEAITRLEESLKRYPDEPQAVPCRYLLADAYRQSAHSVEQTLEEDLVESARLARVKKISHGLDAALGHYRQVQEALSQRQQTTELTEPEKAMLRNCYFCMGSILFHLKQYDEAIRTYTTAANRYQNVPEVLEAYVQIARAYRRLNNPEEAQRALAQAKVVLARMKTTQPFERTTIYTEEQWPALLDWLSSM